jgi:hypothetical protein
LDECFGYTQGKEAEGVAQVGTEEKVEKKKKKRRVVVRVLWSV